MPRVDAELDLRPSVLDRLIDREPRVSEEPVGNRSQHLAELKAAVKRDLEWLLNSKQVVADLPADLRQIRVSTLTYGLPDFSTTNLGSPADQAVLLRVVEEAIGRFEPRLSRVVVTLENGREAERSLHFQIDALLKVEPEPEPVRFDSVLQLNNKSFVVKGE